MEPVIKAMYTPEILAEVKKRFGVDSMQPLDGFENFIYAYHTPEGERILRVSHDSRRPLGMVTAELDFIEHLHRGGVGVCSPVLSAMGNRIEVIPAKDGHFLAVGFHKAPGGFPEKGSPELQREIGAMLGRMHRLTKTLPIPEPPNRRPYWYEDVEGFAEKYLGPGEEAVAQRFHEITDTLKSLSTGRNEFGLVHSDFHGGNYFVDNGRIWLFDFDDCQYNWFAADIAITLFYSLPHHFINEQQQERAGEFLRNLLIGYRSENNLDPAWLQYIPLFLKQREIDLYIVIRRSIPEDHYDEWVTSYMTGRKEKIEANVPYWGEWGRGLH
jgi:Ser/Thr protein kinase RdoA (MazF antagonist)